VPHSTRLIVAIWHMHPGSNLVEIILFSTSLLVSNPEISHLGDASQDESQIPNLIPQLAL
jgi:hypothetical protein